MENDHQCSWPADKKGAFSFLLSRKGTSIEAPHDSLRSLFITCFSLQLFRFLKIWCFFLTFLVILCVLFIHSPSFNNNNVLCSIQRQVKRVNHKQIANCLVSLACKSCILLLCWIFVLQFKRKSTEISDSLRSVVFRSPRTGYWTVALRALWNSSWLYRHAAAAVR